MPEKSFDLVGENNEKKRDHRKLDPVCRRFDPLRRQRPFQSADGGAPGRAARHPVEMVECGKFQAVAFVPFPVLQSAGGFERVVLIGEHLDEVEFFRKRDVLPFSEHGEAVESVAEIDGKSQHRDRRERGALRDERHDRET